MKKLESQTKEINKSFSEEVFLDIVGQLTVDISHQLECCPVETKCNPPYDCENCLLERYKDMLSDIGVITDSAIFVCKLREK